jgi:hypothetical protein
MVCDVINGTNNLKTMDGAGGKGAEFTLGRAPRGGEVGARSTNAKP